MPLGGLGLAVYGLIGGDVSQSWFRTSVLVLLGWVLLEVQGERRTLANAIRSLTGGDRAAGPYESRNKTYLEAARLIRETVPATDADAVLLLSSLHGHAGPHVDSTAFEQFDTQNAALTSFRHAIVDRLRSNWQLKQVVSFTSEQRLDAFLARLESLPPKSRMEVRAFVESSGIPTISTLVVARKTAILAADDDQIFGVGSGVQLDGPELARWAENHFDDLWGSAPFKIWRPALGRDSDQISELRAVLADRAGSQSGVVVDQDGPGSYARATAAIDAAIQRPGEIEIDLANLHGLSPGPRLARPDLSQPWIEAFEASLDRCLIDHSNRSRIRAIYNVNSLDRLAEVEAKIERWHTADRLEIRALVLGDAVATISPLVIGDEELLLGAEGDRLYRTARSLRLRGTNAAAWGRRYFELVWNDRRSIPLRTANGVNADGLNKLRRRLAKVHA